VLTLSQTPLVPDLTTLVIKLLLGFRNPSILLRYGTSCQLKIFFE
jgi:hypothetical protein